MLSDFIALGALCLGGVAATTHDGGFEPDYVLVATEEEINVDCTTRRSVVVNGTFPGPTVELAENQTTWIRVYNNIPDQNFTMVSLVEPVGTLSKLM